MSCIILSGGRSARMGCQKADLRFSDTESFLLHLTRVYQMAGIRKITIVANPGIKLIFQKEELCDITWINNPFPEYGRGYSLQLGLAQNRSTDFCFVQNIDNPFTTIELIRQLTKTNATADYAVPVFNGKGGHPILLSSKVMAFLLNIRNDDFKLNEVLKQFKRAEVTTEEEQVLVNINTPDDYTKFFVENQTNTC